MKKNRRQFLANTGLAVLATAAIPKKSIANNKKSKTLNCNKTTLDYYGEGPFYTDNPPEIENNKLALDSEKGQRLIVSGRVLDLSCGAYIPNTKIDIWHADDDGAYDNSTYNLRGVTYANDQGFYFFETILPGKYLNGNKYRPSHIHFKITPPNFPELITQLYFEGDEDIAGDNAASITDGTYDARDRIIQISENQQGVLEGNWDIVIDGKGTLVNAHDLHIERGMIYELSPNPFSDSLKIEYGIFKAAKAGLFVFDVNGRMVAGLNEQNLTTDKYEAIWKPESSIANGHYFITLKVNDLQVHYLKVLLER